MKHLVLDTNIILLDHNNILTLGQDYTIVLPETVVQELDTKKTLLNELGYQARAFGRLLAQSTNIKINNVIGNLTEATLIIDDVTIKIVSAPSYPENSNNDQKIISIATAYNSFCDTTFMSNDVACRIQAMAKGLKVSDLKEVEQTTYKFTKHLNVPSEFFPNLHNAAIAEIDPDYTLENHNYIFTDLTSGNTKLGIVHRGVIEIIGRATEAELRKQEVNPIGAEQLLLSRAIQRPDIDVIICEARAGSGKTLVTLSNAMRLVKGNNPYDSIVYIRASIDDVEKIEEMGFRSGNDEKVNPYFTPVEDSLEHIMRAKYSKKKGSQSGYEAMIQSKIADAYESYNIQLLTGLGLRGRTFTNAVIIIDEVQGQSKASLQKMLTRIGKDCKVIIIGSQRQIDNQYVTKFNNGLSVLMNEATKPQPLIHLHAVNLSKVIRSNMAEWSENIFSKDLLT